MLRSTGTRDYRNHQSHFSPVRPIYVHPLQWHILSCLEPRLSIRDIIVLELWEKVSTMESIMI